MNPIQRRRNLFGNSNIYKGAAKRLLDNAISSAYADGGTFKQSNYNATIDRIVAAMNAFGTTDLSSRMVAWVDPEYLPYRQSTEAGTASLSGCRKLYDLFRRADFTQTTPASMPLLLLHSGENYWHNSGATGNYCSTPNAAANQITGDIDIRAKVNFAGGATGVIISKYNGSPNLAYNFRMSSAGALTFLFSPDGTTVINASSSINVSLNTDIWVRVTRVASTGVITFFTSSDGVTWSQLGIATTTTSGNIIASSSILEVGSRSAGAGDLFTGRIYRAQIYNGINGTLAVDFNPQSFNPSSSQTQWTSATGEVWTINLGSSSTLYKGALVYRNMIMSDAVDDSMASGNVTIGGQKVGIYSSVRLLNNVNALNTYLELSSASSTNNESFGIFNADGTNRRIYSRVRGTTNSVYTSTSDVFTSMLALHSLVIDTSLSTDISLFYNKSSISINATGTDQSNSFTTAYPLYLFARDGNTLLSNMSLHDLMLVTDITKRTEMENIIRSMSQNFAF